MVRNVVLACCSFLAVLPACRDLADEGALMPPTADQDARLPSLALRVAGRERLIHIETYGDPSAPALFVLHGSLSDFRAFRPMVRFSDRYFVVLWDQRGNGLSERITEEEYSFDSVVEEIAALKTHFSLDRPIALLGHSFGGMYAALYTSRHPDDVRELILLEPGPLTGRIMEDHYGDVINVDLLGAGLNEMFWENELLSPSDHVQLDYRALLMLEDGHLTNYFCDPDHPPQYPVWRPGGYVEILRGLRMTEHAGPGETYAYDFATGLDVFKGPVTFFAGTCSALGPDFQRSFQLPLFNDPVLEIVPDAGHRLLVERPELVLGLIREHLLQYR